MRILVCSKRDLSSVVILNDLLERIALVPDCHMFLILAERTRPVETIVPELIRMKLFERDLPFGTFFPLIDGHAAGGRAETPSLDEIIERFDLPVADANRNPVAPASRLRTLDGLVAWHGIPHLIVRRTADPEVLAVAQTFAPDLIVSARFSFVFGPPFLSLARHGVVNIHPGRLPDYAGLYPHFHSMLAGEKALGCTVHLVDQGIDSGPVLATGEVPIDRRRSAFAHNLDSHLLGNRLVLELIEKLVGGERLAGVPQDRSRLRSYTYPKPEEFEAFRKKGLSLIDTHEYVALLRRFGLLDGRPQSTPESRLPDTRDSAKLTKTH